MNCAPVFGVWHDIKTCWPPGGHQRLERRDKREGEVKSGNQVWFTRYSSPYSSVLYRASGTSLRGGFVWSPLWVCEWEWRKTSRESTTVHFICLLMTNQGFIVHSFTLLYCRLSVTHTKTCQRNQEPIRSRQCFMISASPLNIFNRSSVSLPPRACWRSSHQTNN